MIKHYAGNNIVQCSFSERGKYHIDENLENQDSVYIGRMDDETSCIAVADGVSSCKWAKKGSLAAVDTVRHLAKAVADERMLCEDVDSIREFVVKDWKAHFHDDWNEYGTTLNFAIIHKKYLVSGQIGDGMLLSINGNERLNLTDTDEFYSAETAALSEVVLKSSFKVLCKEIQGPVFVAAMTDGISKELDTEYIEEFKNSLKNLMKKEKALIASEVKEWIAHLNQKNDDDKSIVILILEE